jgi:drug/metabolite transporter (DMT)-like permease
VSLKTILLALVTVALNSLAQLLLRGAALRGATATDPLSLAKSPLFLIALVAYAASVLTWLSVLKAVPLPVAMPFLALVYVAVPLAARVLFRDALSWQSVVGMALVASGIVVVARG